MSDSRRGFPEVFVIDDHDDTRQALAELIADRGYSVHSFATAVDALDLLRSGVRPSYILLDLDLPTLSGWGFCGAVSAEPSLIHVRDVPIGAITGLPEYRGVPFRPVDAGVFRKPLDIDGLLESIRTHVGDPAALAPGAEAVSGSAAGGR
jgi:CheY-like chemotaxis protein